MLLIASTWSVVHIELYCMKPRINKQQLCHCRKNILSDLDVGSQGAWNGLPSKPAQSSQVVIYIDYRGGVAENQ